MPGGQGKAHADVCLSFPFDSIFFLLGHNEGISFCFSLRLVLSFLDFGKTRNETSLSQQKVQNTLFSCLQQTYLSFFSLSLSSLRKRKHGNFFSTPGFPLAFLPLLLLDSRRVPVERPSTPDSPASDRANERITQGGRVTVATPEFECDTWWRGGSMPRLFSDDNFPVSFSRSLFL